MRRLFVVLAGCAHAVPPYHRPVAASVRTPLRELGLVNDELSERGKLAAEELASSGVTIVR